MNYIVFDPELHWCKPCQAFPQTAKDYLIHLHTKEHAEKNAKNPADAVWRTVFQKTNDIPSYPNAPTKRVPIRGLQFFEPATAWFCKLCEIFMGDTWCASLHLKSELHTERYEVSCLQADADVFIKFSTYLFTKLTTFLLLDFH